VCSSDLYRYAQEQIEKQEWGKVDRIFRLLDEAYQGGDRSMENAIRASFLEYFEFQGCEATVRSLFGDHLTRLYEDQMIYMTDLAKRANKQA
jgi:hypothetical protein